MLMSLVILAGMTFVVSTGNTIAEAYNPHVYEDHDVAVQRILTKHMWLVRSPFRGEYQIIFCDNPSNNVVLDDVNGQSGYSLDTYRWQVTGYGCSNVADETFWTGKLGFWWHKERGIIVKVAENGGAK